LITASTIIVFFRFALLYGE